MQVRVNGEPREVAASTSVAQLLAEMGLNGRPLAVERNYEIVPRSRHADVRLCDGDQLEVVTLVGGG